MMRVRNTSTGIALALLLASAGVRAELAELSGGEMAEVVAREGIAAELAFEINANSQGQPSSSNCDMGVSSPTYGDTTCRLGIQFNNRAGEWLVIKNFYGAVNVPTFHIDSDRTPASPTQYEDLSRFTDEQGVPLLTTPHDLPTVAFSFPEAIEVWDLTLGGLAVEYDDGSGTPGFLRNQNGSAVGFQMGNSQPNSPAELEFQGRAVMFGF